MNRILSRQLRRLGLDPTRVPDTLDVWQGLLSEVADAYEDADRGRYLLERSMEISSREMQELNHAVEELSYRRVERSEQHYRHLFTELPVAAWEEDFRAVAARFEELRAAGVTDLRTYFEQNPGALAEFVALVEVVDFNRAVHDLIGICPREDLLGPVDPSLLDQDSLASWQAEFEAIWEGRNHVSAEFTGQRLDGTRFPAALHWTVSRVRDKFDFSKVIVVVIDITDRIAAEERMRQVVKSKDEFLATVSHELRTPLTSVVGYAEVLRGLDLPDAEQRAMVETIADQAADLSNIVEDLLVGARAELGQLDVDASPFDVFEVVQQVLAQYDGVVLAYHGPGPVVAVGDCARVRQILRNLMSNAGRYGGSRHMLTIDVNSEWVTLSVCDDGPPLPTEIVERIFDRYYRGRNRSGRPGSVGIGLTISRDLARMMNGDLVYQHDGAWGRFELTVPVAPTLSAVA